MEDLDNLLKKLNTALLKKNFVEEEALISDGNPKIYHLKFSSPDLVLKIVVEKGQHLFEVSPLSVPSKTFDLSLLKLIVEGIESETTKTSIDGLCSFIVSHYEKVLQLVDEKSLPDTEKKVSTLKWRRALSGLK